MTENILAKESGDDLMLYDIQKDTIHVLNPTARIIYNLYKEGKPVSEIENIIRKNFQYDESYNLINDIEKCLDDLRGKGVLQV